MNSSLTFWRTTLFAWILFGSGSAWTQPIQGEAVFEFHATSTLKDFSGTAVANPVALTQTPTPEGSMLSGTITVEVAGMDTRHAKRDENMRRMFDEPQFPHITGTLSPFPIPIDGEISAPLLLTIRDQTTPVQARLRHGHAGAGDYSFHLDLDLSLKQLGLSPPVFLGFLRVGDEVRVQGRITVGVHPE